MEALKAAAEGGAGLGEVGGALEVLADGLEEAWRAEEEPPFPEPRMARLLDTVGDVVARAVADRLGGLDLFGSPEGLHCLP